LVVLDARRSPASDTATATRTSGLPSDTLRVAGHTGISGPGPSVAAAITEAAASASRVAVTESDARGDVDMDESKATGSEEVTSWERRMPSTVRQ
jgi:hypothetical protein